MAFSGGGGRGMVVGTSRCLMGRRRRLGLRQEDRMAQPETHKKNNLLPSIFFLIISRNEAQVKVTRSFLGRVTLRFG